MAQQAQRPAYAVMISTTIPVMDDQQAMQVIGQYERQGFQGAVYEYGGEDLETSLTVEVWRWSAADDYAEACRIAEAAAPGLDATLYGPGQQYIRTMTRTADNA